MIRAKYLALAAALLSSSANASIGDIVYIKAKKHGVSEDLIHAVIRQESGYNPNAVSRVGAGGLMQLMPETAKRFGVSNRFDPEQNIEGGVKYLRFLLDLFDWDVKKAVAGYNAGEGAVLKYGGVPPYPETQNYVKKVLGFFKSSVKQVIYAKSEKSYWDNKSISKWQSFNHWR